MIIRNFLAIFFGFLFLCSIASAQTTAFSYQGMLNDNGVLASGNYDIEFKLFDVIDGGSQVGSTLQRLNVAVANGTFTVSLDFGAAVFSGAARFLDIAVRNAGGGAFSQLTPRQPIISAPYAIQSLNASTATTAANAATATNFSGSLSGDVTGTQSAAIIAPNAVTTSKIADSSITNAKLSNGSVTDAKIVDVAGGKVTGTLPVTTIPAGSNNYIQNSSSNDQTANFTINGTGIANIFNARTYFLIAGSRILWNAGTNNLFAGVNSGSLNTGVSNSFFGASAGQANTSGGGNSFFGKDAGWANTTGFSNSFFGTSAGYSNTSGDSNAFFGRDAGFANTSGVANAFFGRSAGSLNSTGMANSFFGYFSGKANSTGIGNSFFGTYAGQSNTTGYDNSFFGIFAASSNTAGNSNSFFGRDAGYANSNGSNNVFIGRMAGFANTVGNSNTIIGDAADLSASDLTFATAIGSLAVVSSSNQLQLGRDGSDTVRIGSLAAAVATNLCVSSNNVLSACTSSRRYKENIKALRSGLNLIQLLRPVTFDWKGRSEADIGLVAEEVAAVEPRLVTLDRDGEVQGVKYDQLSVVLIEAIKEQQTQIDAQSKLIEQQAAINRDLQTQIAALNSLFCRKNRSSTFCRTRK